MIYDTFLFCHELDLLEVRLRVLYDYVDKFVLLECPYSHAGKEKPLYFEKNKSRFDWAKDKIIHLVGNDVGPLKHGRDFALEYAQREYLYRETLKLGNHDDVMLISDLDEIPSREALDKIRKGEFISPTVMRQEFYYYNIQCPWERKWTGTMVCKFSHILPSIENTRGKRAEMTNIEGNCGWHFSYFFTPEDIKFKLRSFAHHGHLGSDEFLKNTNIPEHIKSRKSFVKVHERLNDNQEPLPEYLINELKKFPTFMGVQ